MSVIIQLRRDTSTNFTTINPILAEGEGALELDTKRVKVGNGIDHYNDLPYWVKPLTSSDVTSALGYTPYDSSNPSGYISGITSSDIITALGFTPYSDSNPEGYISGITSTDVIEALGFTPYSDSNPEGYISGITSSDVTTALGFTPYDSSNPAGYTSNQGTVTSVNNVQPVNGNVTIEIPDSATWGNITGDIADQTDLSTALGNKVDKTSTANKVYGTDANGDQTTYDVDSFGQVDDVTVGGTSVVTNKVAVLGSMAGETASDYATAAQGALADSAVQTINNIAPIDGNVIIEAGTGLQLSNQNEFNILQEDERDSSIIEIGSPLEVENLVYTNFSTSNYLKVSKQIQIGASDTFEIAIKFKQSATKNGGCVFCGGTDDGSNYLKILLSYSSYKYIYRLQSMGTIGRMKNDITSLNAIEQPINTYIWLRIRRASLTMYFDYSTDGSTWVNMGSQEIYSSTIGTSLFNFYLGNGADIVNSPCTVATIDLNHCYIKVNDITIWDGSGIISKPVAKATNSLYGLVKPDGTSITVNDGTISSTVEDVQINSTSILSNRVANIPISTSSALGVCKVNPNQGISAYSAGDLVIISASEAEIIAKTHNYKPIVPSKLDIAVREGLGNNSLTWTDAYKASARNTIGATQAVFVDWEG